MSVYNGEKYLKDAINSILSQSFRDFEFIIINDASTDKTADILKSYADKRIKIINNVVNIGLTKSLNKGISEARGIYIARMDADDISLQQRFAIQKRFLDEHQEIACVGTMTEVIDNQNNKTGQKSVINDSREIHFRSILANQIAHPTAMIRKEILNSVGNYNEDCYYAQDFELWSRICHSGFEITNIDKTLIRYRFHQESITQGGITKDKAYDFVKKIIMNNISNYMLIDENQTTIFLNSFHKHQINTIKELLAVLNILSKLQNKYIKKEKPDKQTTDKITSYIRNEKIKAFRWYFTIKIKKYCPGIMKLLKK